MLVSEYARQQVARRLAAAGEPVTIDALIADAWRLTDDGDPRWIGVAVTHLEKAGLLRHVTCDNNHQHDSTCTLEWLPA